MSTQIEVKGRTRKHIQTSKFDLEVKGQRCIRIMNIRDTPFYGDVQKWYANVNAKGTLRVGLKSA